MDPMEEKTTSLCNVATNKTKQPNQQPQLSVDILAMSAAKPCILWPFRHSDKLFKSVQSTKLLPSFKQQFTVTASLKDERMQDFVAVDQSNQTRSDLEIQTFFGVPLI